MPCVSQIVAEMFQNSVLNLSASMVPTMRCATASRVSVASRYVSSKTYNSPVSICVPETQPSRWLSISTPTSEAVMRRRSIAG